MNSLLQRSVWSGPSAHWLAGLFAFLTCLASSQLHAQEESIAEAYRLQGEYRKGGRGIQVAATGVDVFRVVFYNGGLPGDGWDRSPIQMIEMERPELREFLAEAQPVHRTSDSLDAKPPKGAVALFDGTQASIDAHWEQGAKLADESNLLAGCTTKDSFRDYRLHLEFKTPFMPDAEGQGRGNSGVYHQARYETQVLDSFGFENEGNTCGAIYGVKPAEFNACLPPGVWQTYDIDFIAARWDASGNKTTDAKLTVWLNGQCIHRDQSVPGPTTAAPNGESPKPGPIYLQDHGNPVVYRNIWLVPIDAESVALRPRVPGYERLAASSSRVEDFRLAGRILVSELGCSACHDSGRFNEVIDQKQAPILDRVGDRLQRGHIASMLGDVHRSKMGTTMPDMLHGMDTGKKAETITAIAAYLESSSKPRRATRMDPQSIQRGEELYAHIGCAVCHGFPDGRSASSTSTPLPDLACKYTFDGLALFLKQPHLVRPSNRMPAMHLDDNEARELASYLLPSSDRSEERPNTSYRVYRGSWDKIPDFDAIEPEAQGNCEGLDLSVARHANNFGVRFDTYVVVDQAGAYRFHLGSDDGSRLFIDGKLVVDTDGVHPHQTNSGEITLETGVHPLRVEFFQGGGEWTIGLEWESDTIVRQSLEGWFQLDAQASSVARSEEPIDLDRIEQGRSLFRSVGCAKCHSIGDPKDNTVSGVTPDAKTPPPLDRLTLDAGCMSEKPGLGVPDYRLSIFQKEAIRAALIATAPDKATPQQHSKFVLSQLNCIACHQRDSWGGPESDKLGLFQSTLPEMGDEGRLPPSLNGIADKLNDNYLAQVLSAGARQRNYMLVRMPQFGAATHGLAEHWKMLDRPIHDRLPLPADEPEIRTIAAGRQLVGTKGLACAQCHTFGNERALGIQAINLLTMTNRLRPEWFYRYMLEPTRYRPGTRMPASFPDGKSVLKTIHDGNSDHQIASMWRYLSQGDKAAVPEGLQRNQIVLEPIDRPILYRNFIEGLSSRGIAVGYPGGANIAWDAETMSIARVWKGQFIDAAVHWRDRGAGQARPLGDMVLALENMSPVAILESANAPWPTTDEIMRHYQFRGYRLDPSGNPTFRYTTHEFCVDDKSEWIPSADGSPGLKRTLTIRMETPEKTNARNERLLCVRIGEGKRIDSMPDGSYQVDRGYRLRVAELPSGDLKLRQREGGNQELVLTFTSPSPEPYMIEYEIAW